MDNEEPLAQSTRIIETTVFTKQIDKLVDAEERQLLIDELILHPAAGDVIKGSGGLRKLRWSGSGRGKRGGTRIIYYWHRAQVMYLLLAYPKNTKDDLSKAELKVLKAVVEKEMRSWTKSSSES